MGNILERLKAEHDILKRRLLLIGYLTEKLRAHGVQPILVGGAAVELYTFQNYTTHDVDLVLTKRNVAGKLLETLNFEKAVGARHWIHEGLELAVEIPDDRLAGNPDYLLEVEVDEFSVFVIGIEDLIVDRLNAFVHWKSISDYEQALKMYLLHQDSLKHDYLKQQARESLALEGLQHLKQDLKDFHGK